MKFLLDTCVWGGARAELVASGHDVVWSGDWQKDPGDEEIMERAAAEGRVLVTLDKDFGELAIVRGKVHCGIVRLVNISATRQAATCLEVVRRYQMELEAGAIATAEAGRLRIRLPDR